MSSILWLPHLRSSAQLLFYYNNMFHYIQKSKSVKAPLIYTCAEKFTWTEFAWFDGFRQICYIRINPLIWICSRYKWLTARSPEMLAPARIPVAAGKKMAKTEKKVSSRKSGPMFSHMMVPDKKFKRQRKAAECSVLKLLNPASSVFLLDRGCIIPS